MRRGLRFALSCACLLLSGVAALIYQVAWTRQFAVVFGTAELAVATVLAAYMGGLTVGAALTARLVARVRAPLRAYAWLELGLAVAALAWVPALLWLSQWALHGLFGGAAAPPASGGPWLTAYDLCASGVTLALPTVLMGATLPLLVEASVAEDAQIASRVGLLYACNTTGAVLGALLASLWLLPALGLKGTIGAAAALNLLVCVTVWRLLGPGAPAGGSEPQRLHLSWSVPGAGWVLPLLMLSGAVSFAHEVLWSRLLQRLVGNSLQALGIMLAGFLCGIALGGALGMRVRDRGRAAVLFGLAQSGCALGAVLAWWLLHHTPVLAAPSADLWAFALLLPLTVCVGATYPLAVTVLAERSALAAAASASAYSWNTAGAIGGALLAGFWLLPALRYEGAVRVLADASLLLSVLALALLGRRRRLTLATLAAAALTVLGFRPAAPTAWLLHSTVREAPGELLYYDVGRSADIVVRGEPVSLSLLSNGLPEASITRFGGAPSVSVEAWMPALAVLARPATRSMLLVGLGAGVAVNAVPPDVTDLDVIELEPRIVEANRAISEQRDRDPLHDVRLHLILNDARSALALSTRRYDAIVSQPSHPWTAGAAHLYTLEFMREAQAHLNAGGVFAQWMGVQYVDEPLLRSLAATLCGAFREVRLYRVTGTTLLFLASDEPLEPERQWAATRAALESAPLHYARLGLHAPEDLVATLALDASGVRALAAGAEPLTDDDNPLATREVFTRGTGLTAATTSALLAPHDPLTDPASLIHRELGATIRFAYVWERIAAGAADPSVLERLHGLAEARGDSASGAYLRYLMAMRLGQPGVGAQLLGEAHARWPEDADVAWGQHLIEPTASAPLPADAQLVLELMRAGAAQRWGEVAARDAALAQVRWVDPWGEAAAQLRCEWRSRLPEGADRKREATQCLAITDWALTAHPDPAWFSLRALSAAGTSRPEVVIEAVAGFAQLLGEPGALTAAERGEAAERGRALRAALEPLCGGSMGARAQAALQALDRALARL